MIGRPRPGVFGFRNKIRFVALLMRFGEKLITN
jgi:hypothetical protein